MKTIFAVVFVLIIIFTLQQIASEQIGTVDSNFQTYGNNSPTGLTWDGSSLWYIDTTDDMIRKIDPASHHLMKSFPAPSDVCTGLAWHENYLWCSDNENNRICKIDTNGVIVKTFFVTSTPRGVEYFDDHVWYVDSVLRQIYKLHAVSGAVVDSITAPAGACRGLAYDGKYLWCSDRVLDEIYKIDIDRKKVIMIINSPVEFTYGLAWDSECIWACGYDSDDFARIYTTGSNKTAILDKARYSVQYHLTVRNAGQTDMSLDTWMCKPVESQSQKFLSDLSWYPLPRYFVYDQWEQECAYWNTTVSPGDSTVYRLELDVELSDIRWYLFPDSVGRLADIPEDILSTYTVDGENYDINNPVIQNAVDEAVRSETNLYWMVRNIHDYIIENIQYDLIGSWDAAPTVLQNGHGSCSEYTYLFVAMCRAAGIPSRYEAGGRVKDPLPYTDTVFHRWHQVYFPNYGWVTIDATWDDKNYPANQARYFGAESNTLFATTVGGGGSNKIGWAYNSANSNSGGSRERSKQMVWTDVVTSVIPVDEKNYPEEYTLQQNFPNPFNPVTTIQFSLPKAAGVKLVVYSITGQEVAKLVDRSMSAGFHSIDWDASSMSSGVYIYKIVTDSYVSAKRMVLVK